MGNCPSSKVSRFVFLFPCFFGNNQICLVFLFVCWTDFINFTFKFRSSVSRGIGGGSVQMQARADAASFCKGFIYAAACTKNGLIKENISKYEVSGWRVCLPPVEVLKLPYLLEEKEEEEIYFDFVLKEENKHGLEDDIELLLVVE